MCIVLEMICVVFKEKLLKLSQSLGFNTDLYLYILMFQYRTMLPCKLEAFFAVCLMFIA